jgi:lipoprotein-anchoring transpeptidase ErfK/SrfK
LTDLLYCLAKTETEGEKNVRTMNRRQFLALSGAASLLAAFPRSLFPVAPLSQAAPAPLGRVATWWRQTVHTEPSQNAPFVASKGRDEIIPLYAAVVGEAPWPTNPIWYQTSGGYIHSGYVQPVEDAPQSEIIAPVEEPGFWAEVCVPVAEATWQPGSPYVAYRLYHGTVYRVIRAVGDGGDWFYQLQDGLTWSPGPFVPTRSLRRIPAEQLTPISPGRPDKTIRINIADQRLTCLEGRHPVFTTRIASGVHGLGTPLGEFQILLQRHTNRMVGGGSDDPYDLPGVPFPVYFTWSGVAIHGTYWHNDYGRRHSHGCVNVTSEAARWVFRWAQPHVPYGEHTLRSPRGEGTRVVVV